MVCVECLAPVDGRQRCPDCNLPICSLKCIDCDVTDVVAPDKCDVIDLPDKCDVIDLSVTPSEDKRDVDEHGHPLKWHKKYECSLLSRIGFKAAEKSDKSRSSASTEVPQLLVQVCKDWAIPVLFFFIFRIFNAVENR